MEFHQGSDRGIDGDIAMCLHAVPGSLARISLQALKPGVPLEVLRHGQTLRALQIHKVESGYSRWQDNVLDYASLFAIQHSCPLIADLRVDIDRAGEWPNEIFDVIAKFRNLQRLELWFELGVHDPEHPVQPFVTYTAAEMIFKRLRQGNGDHPSRSQQLKLRSDASPRPSGWLIPEDYWKQYNNTSIVCELVQKKEDADAGVYKMAHPCTAFEHERQARAALAQELRTSQSKQSTRRPLVRTLFGKCRRKGSRRPGHSEDRAGERRSEASMVAHEGPKPLSQWHAHY